MSSEAMPSANNARVVVLMSTYNGEPFVIEQLNSILSQLPDNGLIMVRDDGSQDRTADLVASHPDPRIRLERGSNLGFGASFLTLLTQAPDDAELVMFSDQDDVWLPHKIAAARAALAPFGDRPALYGSAQMLVDAQLSELQATRPWLRGPSFRGALTENIITGCTAALNQAAVRLLKQAGVPQGVVFHDWWVYLVVSTFGQVVYDDKPSLLYRQHGGNQIGHGAGVLRRYLRIARFLRHNDWVGILLGQVSSLQHHYGRLLDPAQARLLQHCFGSAPGALRPSWQLIFSGARWRQDWAGELALRVLLCAWRLRIWPRRGQQQGTPPAELQA